MFLKSFVYLGGSIQTTRADAQLSYRNWSDIRVCNAAVKNICSAGLLRVLFYTRGMATI